MLIGKPDLDDLRFEHDLPLNHERHGLQILLDRAQFRRQRPYQDHTGSRVDDEVGSGGVYPVGDDVFVTTVDGGRLLHNDGRRFVDVSRAVGLRRDGFSVSASVSGTPALMPTPMGCASAEAVKTKNRTNVLPMLPL